MNSFGSVMANCPCKHFLRYIVRNSEFLRSRLYCFCITSPSVSRNVLIVKWENVSYMIVPICRFIISEKFTPAALPFKMS